MRGANLGHSEQKGGAADGAWWSPPSPYTCAWGRPTGGQPSQVGGPGGGESLRWLIDN